MSTRSTFRKDAMSELGPEKITTQQRFNRVQVDLDLIYNRLKETADELQDSRARVAELEAQTPSALKAKLKSAEARIQELEKWREDAALGLGASRVEALREAREVLRLCAVKPAYPKSAPEYEPVRALCERHGYGAVMACASSQWMESLERQGYPMEGAHVSGPCVGTVTSTINLITRALGE